MRNAPKSGTASAMTETLAPRLRLAGRVQDSIVDGPGLRYVVFTQGCTLACPGCHNPETQPLSGGHVVPVADLVAELLSNPLTAGLTLSGGEPSLQAIGCAALAEAAREHGLNVWCYSGYRVEALLRRTRSEPDLARLLWAVDVLVDGPFLLARRTLALPWRGSSNQRLVALPETLKTGSVVLRDPAADAGSPAMRLPVVPCDPRYGLM